MTEPPDSADIGAPGVRMVHDLNGNHTAAWCGHCRELYDPGAQDDPCPACGAAATAWDADALYRALAPRLVRYVRSLLRAWNVSDARVDAEGAVNEAFLEMIRKARISDATIDDPTAWLFVLARRKAAQAVRKERRICEGDRQDPVEVHGSARWSSMARRPSANDIRGTRLVLQAIADLPDRQRVATYLQTVHGWTLEEIAEYLDCAASTAGVHVHRGKVRVRERLKTDWEPLSEGWVTGTVTFGHELTPAWRRQLLLQDWVRAMRRSRLRRSLSVVLVLIGLIAAAAGLEHWLRLALWLASVLALAGTLVIGGLAAAGYTLWNALRSRDVRTCDPNVARRDPD